MFHPVAIRGFYSDGAFQEEHGAEEGYIGGKHFSKEKTKREMIKENKFLDILIIILGALFFGH